MERKQGYYNNCAITGTVSLEFIKATVDKDGFYADSFIDADGFRERTVKVAKHGDLYVACCHEYDDCEYNFRSQGTWTEVKGHLRNYI